MSFNLIWSFYFYEGLLFVIHIYSFRPLLLFETNLDYIYFDQIGTNYSSGLGSYIFEQNWTIYIWIKSRAIYLNLI